MDSGEWKVQARCESGHAITAVVACADGALWVGTEGDGLYHWDRNNGWDKNNYLPSTWVSTLYLDSQVLWIGTAGGGLSRLQSGTIATFTTREGLLDNSISQIVEDDDGYLWLGGTRGIIRVSKRELDELASHKVSAIYPQVYGRLHRLEFRCPGTPPLSLSP